MAVLSQECLFCLRKYGIPGSSAAGDVFCAGDVFWKRKGFLRGVGRYLIWTGTETVPQTVPSGAPFRQIFSLTVFLVPEVNPSGIRLSR